MNSYIYAETAFHHEGDVAYLHKLIDATAAAGANGIKFQILIEPGSFLSKHHSAFTQLSSFCLSKDNWLKALQYAQQKNLDLIVMPLDEAALDVCSELSVKYLELHSVSFYDMPLQQQIKEAAVPMILGTGGRTLEEIKDKINFFGSQLQVLMTGFQAFPSAIEDVKLGRISALKKMFPDRTIGYADHSSWEDSMAIKSNEYARLLGAEIFEKHITLHEGDDKRTDFSAAVNAEKLAEIIRRLSFIDRYILNEDSQFSMAEEKYRNRQKKVVAGRKLKPGEQLSAEILKTKMIDSGEGFFDLSTLVGKFVNQTVGEDQLIEKFMIDEVPLSHE